MKNLRYVAFIPTTPHSPAGIRILPPPSAPIATGHNPAPTAQAEPEELPPQYLR